MRKLAGARLAASIGEKQLEVQLAAETVEALGFLLWRHLEHYLLYSNPASTATPGTPYQATLRRLNESKDAGRGGVLEYSNSPRSKFPSVCKVLIFFFVKVKTPVYSKYIFVNVNLYLLVQSEQMLLKFLVPLKILFI